MIADPNRVGGCCYLMVPNMVCWQEMGEHQSHKAPIRKQPKNTEIKARAAIYTKLWSVTESQPATIARLTSIPVNPVINEMPQ